MANGLNGVIIQHAQSLVELEQNQDLEHAQIQLHQMGVITVQVWRQSRLIAIPIVVPVGYLFFHHYSNYRSFENLLS